LIDTCHLRTAKRVNDLPEQEAHPASGPDHRDPPLGRQAVHGPARDLQAGRHALDVGQDRDVFERLRSFGFAWRPGSMTALVRGFIKRFVARVHTRAH
jgi:hypothetical protein